ncbi:MAG: S8 family serine peptidase [Gaiellaceae bacterium]
MDPTLRRLVEAGGAGDEVAVMVRLAAPSSRLPAGVRVISRFGYVVTVRVARGAVDDLRQRSDVRSVKAPRLYRPELVAVEAESVEVAEVDERRPAGLAQTGRGVVVGLVDWGLDFRHPAFRRPDGGTRVRALWDQAGDSGPSSANRFGYGRIHDRADIDAALREHDPVAALGYDPARWDVGGGTHGTATTSIAAGSSWPGGVEGLAPDADIVFVNLTGAEGLGHSVTVGEAIDFIRETAAGDPWVVNMSLGRHGGPHDGSTLVEQLLDAAVTQTPGAVIVNSGGNYFSSAVHTTGRLDQGDVLHVPFELDESMRDLHEIDVWYSGADRLMIGLLAPDGRSRVLARPDGDVTLSLDGRPVARVQHRTHDPNNGRNQAVLRIRPDAPPGAWHVIVVGADVSNGRFHAWIEREALTPASQARFEHDQAVPTTTTGTICNGLRTIAVGAYDAHDPARRPTSFSSSGDTLDGRRKPNLLAPGARVLVARSRPRGMSEEEAPLSTRMSGTSMAAPFVTGTIACMLEAAGQVPAARLRAALLDSADPFEGDDRARAGTGYLDVRAAVEAALALRGETGRSRRPRTRRVALRGAEGLPEAEAQAELAEATEAVDEASDPVRPPDAVLGDLGVSARMLFDVYVLGRREDEHARLGARVEVLAGPGDPVEDAPRAGDLLVRGAMGESIGRAATLVDGQLHDRTALAQLDLEPEGRLPGRYAWVIESGARARAREDRFARRVSDRRGYLPHDQALLRVAARPAGESLEETVHRESRDYIRWYQDALNRIDNAHLDVDGILGPLTRAAVRRYQTRKGIGVDGIVGPITEHNLMEDGAAPPPGYAGPPVVPVTPPSPPAPPGDDAVARWRRLLGTSSRDGNDVVELVDGPETLRAMLAAIRTATGRGHYVYQLGWWLDLDEPLAVPTGGAPCPPPPRGGPSTMRSLLTAASAAGVQVRTMLWDQTGSSKNTAEIAFVNGLANGAGILDNHQLAFFIGSQHQKVLVVKGSEGLVAFCGGIDMNCDRVCPPGLCAPPGGSSTAAASSGGSGSNPGQPLHDVHCRIAGPAARDLLGVVVKRWFSNPAHVPLDTSKGPLLGLSEPPPPPAGPALVRVGETYNATARMPTGTTLPLPTGTTTFRDRTVQEILLTVIGQTRRFIYIEDQYLVNLCAAEAIRRALPRLDHVTILIAASEISDMPRRWELRKRFIDHIRTSPQAHKLRVFTLCTPAPPGRPPGHGPHTYVHAKMMIADDEVAVIGSANMNRRGWEHDAEVVAAVVGPGRDGTPLPRTLRTRLWSEHLGVPAAAVADPILSKGIWLAPPSRRVCPYNPTADTDSFTDSLIPVDVIDPPMLLASAPCCAIHGPSCPRGTAPTTLVQDQPALVGAT